MKSRKHPRVLGACVLCLVSLAVLALAGVSLRGAVGDGPVTTCPILGLESQGEGVAWLDDERVALTSERGVLGRGTVAIVHCSLPQ